MQIKQWNCGKYDVPPETKNGICVDVGSNVGSFSCRYANHFGVIYAFEPVFPIYTYALNSVLSCRNIISLQLAVWSNDGKNVKLKKHKSGNSGAFAVESHYVYEEDYVDSEFQAKTISLPTILKMVGGHIHYLKVDCETAEYPFLMDQDLTEIDFIGIEIHNQIGEELHNRLVKHLLKTHVGTFSKYNPLPGHMMEVTLQRRDNQNDSI